jgi:flagella basal body P-ring formation protein FlgA
MIIVLLLCLLQSNLFAAPDSIRIKMYPESHINAEEIRLGDISEIKTSNWELTKKLGDIVIGTVPIPGRSRYIKRNDIMIKLKQNRINISQLKLESSKKIKIIRNAMHLSKETIENILLAEIKKGKLWDIEKVQVKKIQVAHGVTLPQGTLAYEVVPPVRTKGLGPVPLQVIIRVDGNIEKKVTAIVYTKVMAEVVVVKRPLRRFQTISPDDIMLRKMDLNTLSSNSILSYREVIGKRTTRVINPNTVLRVDLVEFPPLIKRKDMVRIVSESDRLKITTLGEALEKGSKGQRIKVVNVKSGEKNYAHVVDAKTVRIDF